MACEAGAAPAMPPPAAAGPPLGQECFYVRALPKGIDDTMLGRVFGMYCSVVDCKVLSAPGDVDMAEGGAVGVVRAARAVEAAWVVNSLNGKVPQGLLGPVSIVPALCRIRELEDLYATACAQDPAEAPGHPNMDQPAGPRDKTGAGRPVAQPQP